jgi:hypothetical protein
MHGAEHLFSLGRFLFSHAWQALVFLAPFLAVAALWWLIGETDRLMGLLFPHAEWEKSLGWLNIRAQRRADTALRWVGYGVYAVLAAALYGIAWGAQGLQVLSSGLDPNLFGYLAWRIAVLTVCLGAWTLYLGCWLVPKLRAQRELKALKRFRSELEEAEREQEMHAPSRIHAPLPKPRVNAPRESVVSDRTRRRR